MKFRGLSPNSLFFLLALLSESFCQQEQKSTTQQQSATPTSSQQLLTLIIIIGGYVALVIGAVIFRLEARESKVVQFQQMGARGSSTTEHKFEELQEENDQSSNKKAPSLEYESAEGDSTKRKRRKRKADRLSDRRKNNQSNESNEQNEEAED